MSFEAPISEKPKTLRGNPFELTAPVSEHKESKINPEQELVKKIGEQALAMDYMLIKHNEVRHDLARALTKRNEFWVAAKGLELEIRGLISGEQNLEHIAKIPKLKPGNLEEGLRILKLKKQEKHKQLMACNEQLAFLESEIPRLQSSMSSLETGLMINRKIHQSLFEQYRYLAESGLWQQAA